MVFCLFLVLPLSWEAFLFLAPVLPEPDPETLLFSCGVSLSALVFPLLVEKKRVSPQLGDWVE